MYKIWLNLTNNFQNLAVERSSINGAAFYLSCGFQLKKHITFFSRKLYFLQNMINLCRISCQKDALFINHSVYIATS